MPFRLYLEDYTSSFSSLRDSELFVEGNLIYCVTDSSNFEALVLGQIVALESDDLEPKYTTKMIAEPSNFRYFTATYPIQRLSISFEY